jgi:hypothetical protein
VDLDVAAQERLLARVVAVAQAAGTCRSLALLVVRRELALVILDVNLLGVSGYEL